MPTYEYRCRNCGAGLEVVQSFTDDSLTACPECGGVLRKVFGSIGITFKGSGFYKTDSRAGSSASSKSSESSSTSSESSSPASDGAKGDSKAGDSKAGDSKAGEAKKAEPKKSDTSAA